MRREMASRVDVPVARGTVVNKPCVAAVSSTYGALLELQRTAGNRAVGQLLSELPVGRSDEPHEGEADFRRHGQHLLAHELTHVVQQAQGSVPQVSRVMDNAAFKAATSEKGPRHKIKAVDNALRAYRALDPSNAVHRFAAVQTLINRCNAYLALPDDSAKRKPGVRMLLREAEFEEEIYDPFSRAANENDKVAKVRLFNEALEHDLAAKRAGVPVQDISFSTLIRPVVNSMTPNEKQALVDSDLAQLQQLTIDPAIPDITRNILLEVLGNRGSVKLTEGQPGAKTKRPWENQPEDYTVEHAVVQSGGAAERLGSLAHELTHVSVGESYDNSSFLFMIGAASTPEQIVAKAQQRQTRLSELRARLAADTTLADDQRGLVESKLDYGGEDKLPLYKARYGDAADQADRNVASGNNVAQNQQKGAFYRQDALAAKNVIDALEDSGLPSSLLVEYDTVINQILVYMHMWRVPTANLLYTKVREVGQEVYAERAAARG